MNNVRLIEATELTMSSREIAELCNKRHAHVCRDIRTMLDQLELAQSKFGSGYLDTNGQSRTEYQLPKNLTLNLIAGYHADIRLKIIDRWLELESTALSPIDALIEQCKLLKAQERRLTLVETEQTSIKQKLSEFDGDTGYMTVIAFSRANDLHLPLSQANALGRKAARVCRERGLHIGSIPDERFGRVNSYPIHILEELAA
jgi:phage regulator Rha-like protein